MFSHSEVFVFVHERSSSVGDLAGIVIHREAVGGPLGRRESWMVCQPCPQRICQILCNSIWSLIEAASYACQRYGQASSYCDLSKAAVGQQELE